MLLVRCYLLKIINNLKRLKEKKIPDNCLHTKLILYSVQIRWPLEMLLMEIWQLSQLLKLTHKLFLQKTLRECMNTSQRKTLLKSLKYFYNSTVSEYQLMEHPFGHIICSHFFYKNTFFISLFLFAMKEYQTCSSSQDRMCLLALKSQTVSKAPADILLH